MTEATALYGALRRSTALHGAPRRFETDSSRISVMILPHHSSGELSRTLGNTVAGLQIAFDAISDGKASEVSDSTGSWESSTCSNSKSRRFGNCDCQYIHPVTEVSALKVLDRAGVFSINLKMETKPTPETLWFLVI